MANKFLAAALVAAPIAIAFQAAPAAAAAAAAQAPQCEVDHPVVFAGLDWDSNAFQTEIARYVLEHGYGCETDVIPGSTIPLLNGMARGDIDVTMEMWIPNVKEAWSKAVKQGKVAAIGTTFPDATQHWFVPKYLVQGPNAPAPGLKSVSDLPKYKKLFADPEEPGKGRFYNCILGWGCEVINTKKLNAYGLLKDYTNFRPGTGGALSAAIESHLLRKQPIVFYYWGPTWVLGKIGDQVVPLEEPPFDQKIWDKLTSTKNPEDVKQATAYPTISVSTAVNAKFEKEAPKLVKFLANYGTTSAAISKSLAHMRENDASAKDTALWWLQNNQDTWTKWVPADVASRVEAALPSS